jgi:demethylmenaquinone methyltransferase/2-methoxy-6-polyprenyl-1,4-benzoquinol methylase
MTEGNTASPERIREMFDRIAGVYDPMNAVISGFQEPRWRRRAVREARLGPGMRALDVACGSGLVAVGLHDAVSPGGEVVGVDFSPRMIEVAARRTAARPGLSFRVGDALELPVEDATFDAATIAFGMRNLADYGRGFAELRRAVRPGGRVVCLEIARPRSPLGRTLARWFDNVVPLIGRVARQGDAYAYLVRSTKAYPRPARIAAIMTEAGLEDVRWFPMSAGLVTIHVGRRGG